MQLHFNNSFQDPQKNSARNFAIGMSPCCGLPLPPKQHDSFETDASRLPDASVPFASVERDIAALASVGAGLEFLPYYLYGIPGTPGQATPTDWNKYGFGTPAYVALFKKILQAVEDVNVPMDYANGANQGQGVPSQPMTPGLALELVRHTHLSRGLSVDELPHELIDMLILSSAIRQCHCPTRRYLLWSCAATDTTC